MVNQDIVNYIENHLKKDISIDKIRKKLLDAHHKIIDVESALAHVNHKRYMFRVLMVSGFVFILLIIGFVSQETPGADSLENAIVNSPAVTEQQFTEKTETDILPDTDVSDFGLPTARYDRIINRAVITQSPQICDVIENDAFRHKCREFAEESVNE